MCTSKTWTQTQKNLHHQKHGKQLNTGKRLEDHTVSRPTEKIVTEAF